TSNPDRHQLPIVLAVIGGALLVVGALGMARRGTSH
ncbi:MAG: hypothetical protein QOE76_1063, partial [Frankiales bacterium]|nr:hypothetical protein [Frankiales bacterium]